MKYIPPPKRIRKDNCAEYAVRPPRCHGQNGTAGFDQKTPVRTKFFCFDCTKSWKSNGLDKSKQDHFEMFALKHTVGSCPHCKSKNVIVLARSSRVPRKGSNAMTRFKKYHTKREPSPENV